MFFETRCTYGIHLVCVYTDNKYKVLTVFVNGGDCSVPLNVTFRPRSAERCTAEIYISIRHNIYEDTVVQVIGEGYVETITIDDISCSDDFDPPLLPPPPPATTDEEVADEEEEDDMIGLRCKSYIAFCCPVR